MYCFDKILHIYDSTAYYKPGSSQWSLPSCNSEIVPLMNSGSFGSFLFPVLATTCYRDTLLDLLEFETFTLQLLTLALTKCPLNLSI